MALRQKLLLAFLIVVIIPITMLGAIIIELIITRSDEIIAGVVEHQMVMARQAYAQQGENVKRGLLQAAAESETRRAIAARDDAGLRSLIESWHRAHPEVDLWFVTDGRGELLARYSPHLPWKPDPAPARNLLLGALSTAQPLVSTELLQPPGPAEARIAQVVLMPVVDGQRSLGAIAAIDLLDNNTWFSLPAIPLSDDEAQKNDAQIAPVLFLTRQKELVTASLPELLESAGAGSAGPFGAGIEEGIDLIVDANWGFRGRGQLLGKTYFLAGEPIYDSANQVIGSLFVGLPYRKYFGLQAQTGWIVTTMLVFSGIISFITASLIASAMTQPIQNLIEKAGLLAGGDLSARASVSGQDEIAQLGRAFNDMARHLEASYDEIEQERQRALAIIEASADGIWVVNRRPDGTRQVSMVNSALERMTGRPRRQLLGRRCHGLIGVCTPGGESICDTTCPFTRPDKRIDIVQGLLHPANRPAGDETPVEISHGRLTNRRGELVGLVHIMRDLTLRREVERLKDDFISMVSHELRTPLSHIKGFAGTLLQTDVAWDAETQHDFLSSIDREVDRLTHLVENLLQMSRLEAGGQQKTERHLYHPDELLELALPELHKRADQRRLIVNAAANLPPVLVDGRGIEMVLANLVENAAKCSPPASDITLAVRGDDGRVIFQVEDEGVGIPAAEQPRIFDRFYRGKTTGRGVPGTGLGLAICKRIVEAHEGQIWVRSEPGRGACFSFCLPCIEEEVGHAHTTDDPGGGRRTGGAEIRRGEFEGA